MLYAIINLKINFHTSRIFVKSFKYLIRKHLRAKKIILTLKIILRLNIYLFVFDQYLTTEPDERREANEIATLL